ncbi:hypothetical protein TNCV_2461181 [Trichonephila clavipes]|nr:hypothetical protein TNCV_2461181 [Trichonephila clavipes]
MSVFISKTVIPKVVYEELKGVHVSEEIIWGSMRCDYLHAFFGEIGIFVPVCMVILSASAANHAFFTAREAIQSLPWKIPQYRDKLKEMIQSECMRSVSLTLWKVYKIERSLIFSAMGTLVTYGMLMATLGGIK